MTKALEFRLRPVHAGLKENPIRWNMQLGWAVKLVRSVPSRRPYFYINSFKIILMRFYVMRFYVKSIYFTKTILFFIFFEIKTEVKPTYLLDDPHIHNFLKKK